MAAPLRIAILLSAALAVHADAMVLCATPRGAVVAEERCRKRHLPLSPRDLGLAGPAGPTGPAGPQGAPVEATFRVVDANGTTVGTPLARLGDHAQCLLEQAAGARPFQLVVTTDGRDATPDAEIYFADPACQGTPFTSEPPSLIPRATLLGARLFVPESPHALATTLSSERVDPTCPGGVRTSRGTCCVTFDHPTAVFGAAAREIALSALGLTAPLHVEER